MKYNSAVWIPSIKTLYGSDILFNQAHPFTCELTAEERQQWIRDIERLEKMGAEVIIPGHQKPGMPFDSSSYTFTKDYLHRHRRGNSQNQRRGLLLLRHGPTLPRRQPLYQQRDERRRLQGRQKLELERRVR